MERLHLITHNIRIVSIPALNSAIFQWKLLSDSTAILADTFGKFSCNDSLSMANNVLCVCQIITSGWYFESIAERRDITTCCLDYQSSLHQRPRSKKVPGNTTCQARVLHHGNHTHTVSPCRGLSSGPLRTHRRYVRRITVDTTQSLVVQSL